MVTTDTPKIEKDNRIETAPQSYTFASCDTLQLEEQPLRYSNA